MAQIRTHEIAVVSGDKIAVPNGRAVTVAIWPGPDGSRPRRKSMVEGYIDDVWAGSVSVIDDDTNESLAPQTLTLFVPRSADSAVLVFSGQSPSKVVIVDIPLDD
jgi:hypothetical protein